jgi:hypothetical protein
LICYDTGCIVRIVMSQTRTFTDVIGLWPSAEALARELNELGVTVRQWRNRESIPAAHWHRIAVLAREKGHALTVDDLSAIADEKRRASFTTATEVSEPEAVAPGADA